MRGVEPRPAATVVVARPAEAGVEVLVLRRSSASRFAPGFVVFPGGLVEPGDPQLADRWWGAPGEADRACAVRELYEETGLLLTAGGPEVRRSRELIEEVAFEPAPLDALVEQARWVAPEILEVRFDAAFFSTAVPAGTEVIPDEVEIERAWWARPEAVLRASHAGDAPLMWPTLVTLEALADCASVEDVLALRVDQIEPGREDRAARVRGAWTRPRGMRR
jgi:8-oxo-dGTP pyrophosphatase MutT (NUDIX family)